MTAKKDPEVVLRKPICTWLSKAQYERFKILADASGVTVATYLRSIVIDALDDEISRRIAPRPVRNVVSLVPRSARVTA